MDLSMSFKSLGIPINYRILLKNIDKLLLLNTLLLGCRVSKGPLKVFD